jgi:hypothetical protein
VTRVLNRYFMLTFTYTLRKFKSGGRPEDGGEKRGNRPEKQNRQER